MRTLFVRLTTEVHKNLVVYRQHTKLPVDDLEDARQLCELLNNTQQRRSAEIFFTIWTPYAGRICVEVKKINALIYQLQSSHDDLYGKKTSFTNVESEKEDTDTDEVESERIDYYKT